jgi:subtilisin-like proprotein convertase family protein
VHATALLAIPPILDESYLAFPSYGLQPDNPTRSLPLVDVGLGTAITQDLHGKGALIRRGTIAFTNKVDNAAAAGAEFAVIYNNLDDPALLTPMGSSDFMPIPTVLIGRGDGEKLTNYVATEPSLRVQIRQEPTVAHFNVTDQMVLEHVGVRVQTTHPIRGNLRITLLSPQGTRSILQAFNMDENPGPVDWTYYSTQHFYESPQGLWTLEVTDEIEDFTGELTGAELILEGTTIVDVDADGLDDNWERNYFGDLHYGPLDDPDGDGSCNAREQALRTNPMVNETEFRLRVTPFENNSVRVAFPSVQGTNYTAYSTADLNQPFANPQAIPGDFGESEIIKAKSDPARFFRVRKE